MDTNITFIDTFVELMDGIFWDGYAQQLSADNPAQFKYELNNFSENYGGC
jgi:hypothetical protein